MARIRAIKPEFWKNEILGELPADVQLLFIGLWNLSDRRGFIESRPKRIKAELFPYRNVDVESCLKSLEGEFIRFIVFKEKEYIHILNFSKHQVINKKEAESIIPKEYWNTESTVQAQYKHSIDITGREGKGRGKEGSGLCAQDEIFDNEFVDNEITNVLNSVTENLLSIEQKEKRFLSVSRELKNSTMWQETVAIALHKTTDEVKFLIPEFLKIIKADGEYFKPIKDIQGHFRNWAKRNATVQPAKREYLQGQNIPLS